MLFPAGACRRKVRKQMKKNFFVLASLILVSVLLFSCVARNGSRDESASQESVPDTDPYADQVPSGLNYDGYEYIIAFPQPADGAMDYQVFDDGNVISKIDQAVYTRNRNIENRFGIKISGFVKGFSDTQVTELIPLCASGSDEFSIGMLAFTFSGIPWITSGYAEDWNKVRYVDTDRIYWSQSMSDNVSIKGHSFIIQGKINWTSAMSTQVCFFNTNVAEDYGIENLYFDVDNGTWTFAKLKALAKGISEDLNNDSVYDENDRYGIIQSFYGGAYNWSIAADYTTVLSDSDGLTLNYDTVKFNNILEYCYDLLYNDHTAYVEKFDYPSESKGVRIFFDDRALFMFTDLGHGDFFRGEQSDYGIIPTPKYDEQQKKYCTTNDQWGLSCIISATARDKDRIGAITEALCALSGKLVYPVYYEEVLSERNTRDEESKKMLDLIFSNIVYDVGITLAYKDYYIPLYKLLDPKSPSTNLSSWLGKYSTKIQTQFDDLFRYVDENYGG